MAAMDPILFQKTINLFPQLSEAQALSCILFSTSASYSEIAEIRGKSPVSVKKTLEKAQQNLGLPSVQSIRPMFQLRVLFSTFYYLRTGTPRTSSLKNDLRQFLGLYRNEEAPVRLFPELDVEKALLIYLYCSGESDADICEAFSFTDAGLKNEIDCLLNELEINSTQKLEIILLVRLEEYLINVSHNLN
ncbi:MAG TPA: hypothetical protein VGI71_23770 [Scandinavium sp.]